MHPPCIGVSMTATQTEAPGRVRKHALNDPYARWVLEAGGLPLLLPNVRPDTVPTYLDAVDGLLLTGGDDVEPSAYGQQRLPQCEETDAVRDAFEIALTREACLRRMPILAICRGVQVANVALGGTLIQDIPAQVGKRVRHRAEGDAEPPFHDVTITEGSRLREIAGADVLRVNSYHHQAPDRIAPSLRATARTADGVVEALEDPEHPWFVGVQWHPERTPGDPFQRALFGAFVDAAKRARRPGSADRARGAARAAPRR